MKTFLDRLGRERLFFDGGTGSVLQAKGLKGGELPERWNLTHPEEIIGLAQAYFAAGSDVVNANTFGANRLHYPDEGELAEIIGEGVRLAREGMRRAGRTDGYVALDIGPSGRLLRPLGDLAFDEAVELFAQVVRLGAQAGADLVLIETMSDTLEAKAAVLAARENSHLPVCVTVVFDENGKMLTGGTVDSAVALLEGLRVDALGLNCSLGPDQMLPIAERLVQRASVPVICCPNAGLPRVAEGRTIYDLTPERFASGMAQIASCGVHALGGCCGTTPEFIRQMKAAVEDIPFMPPQAKHRSLVSSFSQVVEIGPRPVIIGERINPTGKRRLKQALIQGDLEYLLQQGIEQEDAGADMLDVNVGLPEIDEAEMMGTVVTHLQGIIALPLQIDTSDAAALERGLRVYNGKALVNSVNAKQETMDMVFPLVAKYGGVVVALPIDEQGIPDTAEGRIRAAEKILREAQRYGIPREDIVFDGLAMTVSADPSSALTTLETIRKIRGELHMHSILGVSNISFGLPQREILNSAFFAMALREGLSCAIINPNSQAMMAVFRAYLALTGMDDQFGGFIGAYGDKKSFAFGLYEKAGAATAGKLPGAESGVPAAGGSQTAAGGTQTAGGGSRSAAGGGSQTAGGSGQPAPGSEAGSGGTSSLFGNILHGMKDRAAEDARRLMIAGKDPMDIIQEELIPALDCVGKGYEEGRLFLPQLLIAAEAAGAAFEVVREAMSARPQEVRGRIILATVRGDIHDIGKNIVRVLLENYGFDVLDLGKDVPPEVIVERAIQEDIALVGLSALMTTTVPSMEETIRLLREKKPDTRVVVGGAVLTQEYADQIGADHYSREAMDTVRYAQQFFSR